ncbi:YczE/YyaS/YitT family protein [Streptobacillus canis]|uniref:YczE/YyaS/YitT family protein n=1 Tax=Streptobacillus canis TaxID=2678686 RepID=UPI0012E2410C|nr:hypothetical protein [Streptobacillus canis]
MNYKKVGLSLFFYALAGFGLALTIKAFIGVSAFSALNVSVADVLDAKVGMVTTFFNLVFMSLCLIFDKEKKITDYVLMFLAIIMFGSVIDFFLYIVLANFEVSNYVLRMLLFILGNALGAFGVGRVMHYNTLKFPIEFLCILLENKFGFKFVFTRYTIETMCVIISLSLSFIYKIPIYVREGTIISLLMFSIIVAYSKKIGE